LKTTESNNQNFVQFQLNGHARIGMFAPIPDSNLYVGISREVTPLTTILASWWISLLIALAGASFISYSALRWLESDEKFIEMPAIVVPTAGTLTAQKPKRLRR